MPYIRCEECGYAWSGSEEAPLSRCPNCGRSDKLVQATDEERGDAAPVADAESAESGGAGFTPSTELATVAAIVLLVLILAASIVTFFFAVSGAL